MTRKEAIKKAMMSHENLKKLISKKPSNWATKAKTMSKIVTGEELLNKYHPQEHEFKFTHTEVVCISIAVAKIIEDLERAKKDISAPYTPDARYLQNELYKNITSVADKLVAVAGIESRLDDMDGFDTTPFFTKES